ncbi:MAG TPA: response regulator [Candidatus Limnocylindrales bacterium]
MAHILLVDDEVAVAARNAAALEAAGHMVSVVPTAAAAFEAVRRLDPDLVVLEAMLDGSFAGFDLARTLATSHPELPLIMLTRADEHLSPAVLAAQDRDGGWLPVERYLAKPVLPDVLVYEVEHLLEAAA